MVSTSPDAEMSRSLVSTPGSSALMVTLSLVSATSRRGAQPAPAMSRLGSSPKNRSNSRSISRRNVPSSPNGFHVMRAIAFLLSCSTVEQPWSPSPRIRLPPTQNENEPRSEIVPIGKMRRGHIQDHHDQVVVRATLIPHDPWQDRHLLEVEPLKRQHRRPLLCDQFGDQLFQPEISRQQDQFFQQVAPQAFASVARINDKPHFPHMPQPSAAPPMQGRVGDDFPIDLCQ